MSDAIIDAVVVEARPPKQRRFRRWVGSVAGCIELWLAFSMVFILLMNAAQRAEGASWLWPVDPLITVIFFALVYRRRKWPDRMGLKLSPYAAAALFLLISWANAMLYELTLSQVPNKYGGMHPTTVGSFVIAQGFYVPLAVLGLGLVRRYHLTFRELFFVAGMTCIYEAVTVGLPSLISPLFFIAPVIIAYYYVVYSRYLSMGLLIIDERTLWSAKGHSISFARKLFYGVLLGVACWTCFVAWGELMIYLFKDFEGYP